MKGDLKTVERTMENVLIIGQDGDKIKNPSKAHMLGYNYRT